MGENRRKWRDIPGRAMTYEQKREIVDKILGAWMCSPSQRLGQLLSNSLHREGDEASDETRRLFYIEDEELAQKVTDFVTKKR